MKIVKKITPYGYDLLINNVLHKRCLSCNIWFEFDGEMGYCSHCLNNIKRKEKMKITS